MQIRTIHHSLVVAILRSSARSTPLIGTFEHGEELLLEIAPLGDQLVNRDAGAEQAEPT